ncbi:MAG: hypothetical protein ACREVO_09190 [Steroidobacteraceae bacterium]
MTGYRNGHVFYDPQIFKQFPENPRGHAPDAEYFEGLLWTACEQYDARIHAYVIESNVASIVIETLRAPLGWVVHDLLAQYSKHLVGVRRISQGSRPFPQRYQAQTVQPAMLPYAVRFVQRREIPAGRHRRAVNHPFSSNLIYCGRRARPQYFVVNAMQKALPLIGYFELKGYFEFMAADDTPSIAHMLSKNVIGESRFADSVQERCRQPARVPSPDEILLAVTGALLHRELEIVCTSTHIGALARALVAWYAMRTGTAQIGAVAGWFDITSSDLRYLIRVHRQKSPHQFLKPLADLFPALDAPAPRAAS